MIVTCIRELLPVLSSESLSMIYFYLSVISLQRYKPVKRPININVKNDKFWEI